MDWKDRDEKRWHTIWDLMNINNMIVECVEERKPIMDQAISNGLRYRDRYEDLLVRARRDNAASAELIKQYREQLENYMGLVRRLSDHKRRLRATVDELRNQLGQRDST